VRKKIILFFNSTSLLSFFYIFLFVGIVVYGNSLFNSFVGDDFGYINHPYIKYFIFWKFFIGSSADLGGTSYVSSQFYRPLMLLVISGLNIFFHQNALYYHLAQLIFHIGNVFLIFLLFRRFSSNIIAFFASLLFLIHPINSETVLYISNFQDVLFLFFGMLGLLVLTQKKYTPLTYALVPCLLFCSLLAKETGILFLFISFFYLFLFKTSKRINWFLILLGTLFLYLIIRFGVAQISFIRTVSAPISTLPLQDRLKLFPSIFSYYMQTFLFPKNLAIAQTWISKKNFLFDILATVSIAFSYVYLIFWIYKVKKKFKSEFLFFSFWLFLGIFFHAQLIPLEMTVADRWFYFPFIGLLGIIIILVKLMKINNFSFYTILVVCIIIIFSYSLRSFIRTFDWKNPIVLYSHDSHITTSYLLEHSLGYELMQQNYKDEAYFHLQKSVLLFQTPFNTNSLGVFYYNNHDTKNAVVWFKKSISLGSYFLSYQNYARVLTSQGQTKEAIQFLNKAVVIFPKNDVFYFLLAINEYKNGNHDEALVAAQKAYNISPSKQNGYVVYQLLNFNPIKFTNE